jgi:hypothetical protein
MAGTEHALRRHLWHAKDVPNKESKKATLLWPKCLNLGSPTWTRTRDLRINSPSLYQLSYQGIDEGAILMTASVLVNIRNVFEREIQCFFTVGHTFSEMRDR